MQTLSRDGHVHSEFELHDIGAPPFELCKCIDGFHPQYVHIVLSLQNQCIVV